MTALRHTLTFTAGFLTRPCCVIPAALSVLGLGGAGVAAGIAPYRLWFIALAAVLFAVSFHWNFIRNRNRAGMAVWGLSALIAAALLTGPSIAPRLAWTGSPENATMTETQTLDIPVTGMACEACARRVQNALAKTAGVTLAEVSFAAKRAHVVFDPQTAGVDDLAAAIRDAGFEPVVAEAPTEAPHRGQSGVN